MRSFILGLFFLAPFILSAQVITCDTLWQPYRVLCWTSITFKSSDSSSCAVTFYYPDGKKKLQEISDTAFLVKKKINFWLPDGTQLLKNGDGIYTETARDSVVYTVKDGLYEGSTRIYIQYYKNNYYTSWKLKASGNYYNNFRNGEWIYRDSSGLKTVSVNYQNDTLSGMCNIYYLNKEIIKASGIMRNCQKEGLWKYYDENQILQSEYNYANGEKFGTFTIYYSNGKPKVKGQYIQENKKVTVQVEDPNSPGWFKSGKTVMLVPIKTGRWLFYDENGILSKKVKQHNKIEVPDHFETYRINHHTYFGAVGEFNNAGTDRLYPIISDCNFY